MIGAALAGAVTLLGVVVVWAGLHPRAESLSAVLARLGQPLPPAVPAETTRARWAGWLASSPPAQTYLRSRASDLRVLVRSPEDEVAALTVVAAAGLLVVPVAAVGLGVAGLRLPPVVALWAALVVAGLAGAIHWSGVRTKAAARRDEFRYTLSAFCDLTVMNLAAGRGVSQALGTAAAQGEGWAFTELRAALAAAYERGSPGSQGLERMAAELEVNDLAEVAGSIRLAGDNGAAVRTTLASKARTIRERLTADAERKAAAITERMGLPAAVVLVGLVVFYVFPAMNTLVNP